MSTPETEGPAGSDTPIEGDRPEQPASAPEPGERARVPGQQGRRQLNRAPGDRYRPATGSAVREVSAAASNARRSVLAAVVVAILGATILTVILGVLASTGGTFAISGLASVAIGLLVANGAIPGPPAARNDAAPASASASPAPARGLEGPAFSRDRATRIAIGIALAMVLLTGFGVWVLARIEGGVLDPITYVWTTFGLGLPAQAIVALIGSAWGAANGPVRWRQ